MRNYFVFNGEDSRDYGVYIICSNVHNGPGRSYDPIEVPGRNGDLLLRNTRLNNVELTYPAFVYSNIKQNIENLKGVLLGTEGYARLTDSYNPDEYRLAYFPGEIEFDMTKKLDAGEFEITFLCKPQRYLLSGASETVYTANFSVTNPTAFTARPLLHIVGYGGMFVGSTFLRISNQISEVYIDCDLMDCYGPNNENLNDYVTIRGNEFPKLPAGATTWTTFTSAQTITSVGMTPRWWRV